MSGQSDGRWEQGAVWERTVGPFGAAKFTIQRVSADGEVVFTDAAGHLCWSTRERMAVEPGWRFIAPVPGIKAGDILQHVETGERVRVESISAGVARLRREGDR